MPNVSLRRFIAALGCAALALAVLPAAAQTDYPNKPIKVVVPYAPGGMTDTSSRAILDRLSAQLGQTIVIENRTGAASTVASNYMVNQPADGYTLYAAPVSLVVNPVLQNAVQYDPRRDFAPISMLIYSPFVLQVNPSLGVKNMKDLLALVRANPDKYAIGTSGLGSINHLAAEYFIRSFDLKLAVVHYRGGAPAAQDLMGGTIQMMFSATNEAAPLIQSGRTVGIAVTTTKRLPMLPELPTVEEAAGIKDFEAVFWMALVAPAGTPQPVIAKLQASMQALTRDNELRDSLAAKGVELKISTPEVVRQHMDRDEAKWGKLIRDLGLKETS
ncbi:MAG: tripartite tricarboxylate transporter substrate binding protein [Burkholderiaceae bacterium]